jgi:hypothetical protein
LALTQNNRAGSDALFWWGVGDSIWEGGKGSGGLSESPGLWGALDAPGGLFDQATPLLAAKTGAPLVARVGSPIGGTGSAKVLSVGYGYSIPSILKPATFGFHGLGGSSIQSITNWTGFNTGHPEQINAAKWAPFAPPQAPTLFLVNWAINDAINFYGGVESANDHQLAVNAFLDFIHVTYPLAQVLWLGCLFINQSWASVGGNHFTGQLTLPGSNPFDLTNPIDVNIAAACAARPGWAEYCPQLDWTLAWTVAHWAEPGPSPGAGWPGDLSMNGLHPTLLCQQLMGQHMLAHLNIVTT